MRVPPGRSERGFSEPPKVARGGSPAPTSNSSPPPRPGTGRRAAAGSESGRGPARGCGSLGNQNPASPREEGLQKGGARSGEETERRPARKGWRAIQDPSASHTPGPRRGRKGPADEEAELTPRSSSERKSGPSSRPSCEVRGARRARGEDGVRETQRETLVPGRRGPQARPAPTAPTARRGLRAA